MRRRHCECVAWIANLPLPVRFFPSPPSHDPSLSGSHTHTPSTMLRIRNHARRVVSVSPSRSLSTSSSPSSSSPASPLPSFTPRVSLSSEVRSGFLGYFNTAGHTILPSSSLVPQGDETLLFTNAGMVQLKDMLVGLQPPPAGSNGRLASAQKCIRAGGKHNDLENTARHHTFFEMLGNFSIGSYFKEEAMLLAWNYLTKELGLPPSRLRISIHHSDDESSRLWTKITGFTESGTASPTEGGGGRIVRLGDADNLWSMGDAPGTPCGPCSEIFFDQGRVVDGDRWLEIWNLVFMQYSRGSKPGELIPLEKPCVDTGMGLERITSVLQHVPTNYDSDILKPSIEAVRRLALKRTGQSETALPYTTGLDTSPHVTALKVIVDHLRSSAFLVAEGVVPSNIGRGYVLRRLIRRGVRFGHSIGLDRPFLTEMLPELMAKLGSTYPELIQREESIRNIIRQEEATFFATMQRGMKVLEEAFEKMTNTQTSSNHTSQPILSGETAFLLYDSFGFPLDLTQVIAREKGASVDTQKFDALMARQKELSKGTGFQTSASSSSSAAATTAAASNSPDAGDAPIPNLPVPLDVKQWQTRGIANEFTGYDHLTSIDSKIVASFYSPTHHSLWLALDRTPFYANQGGQVGDVGHVTLHDGTKLNVVDCLRPYDGCSVIRVHVPPVAVASIERLQVGVTLPVASVSPSHRASVARHHTATHLLHAALKKVIGGGVGANDSHDGGKKHAILSAASINQAGSLVAPDRLRFDFSCPVAITPSQIQSIEDWINHAILTADTNTDATVVTQVMAKEDALKANAVALFGEKYGPTVRVVSIPGYSVELCGGTHVHSLRSVYPFKIVSDSSIASGIRRIEAVAGPNAFQLLDGAQSLLKKVALDMKVTTDGLPNAILKNTLRIKELETELSNMKVKQILQTAREIKILQTKEKKDGKQIQIKLREVEPELAGSAGVLRDACTSLLSSDPDFCHILLCSSTGSIGIAGGVTQPSGARITAKQLWARLDAATAMRAEPKTKLKGGGSEKVAQGVLPIKEDKETMQERLIQAITKE